MGTAILVILLGAVVATLIIYFTKKKNKTNIISTNAGLEKPVCKKFKLSPTDKPNYIVVKDCKGNVNGFTITEEKVICAYEIQSSSNIKVINEGPC
jgi:hypothetical protein